MRSFLFVTCLFLSIYSSAQKYYLLIGTYTSKGSKGIYTYQFDAATGKAEWISNTDSASSPSFLAVSPDKKFVYSVNEGGRTSGNVSAYAFDKKSGKLTYINKQPSGGGGPCHLAISKDKKWITVANYGGGTVGVIGVNKDGSLNSQSQVIDHNVSSLKKTGKERSHVHQTIFTPKQDYVITADLGLDKVFTYKYNPSSPTPLTPAATPYFEVKAKNGPRHLTFHPNGKYAYVIEEISGTVGAYSYSDGTFTMIDHLDSHPADFTGKPGSANIEVSPDGKFLYASNRGVENNLAIYSINQSNGKLTSLGYQPTLGKAPRHFTIDPTGNYLLAANQDTDNIVIFKRDKQTGLLQETGEQIKVSMPVCLQLVK